MRVAVVGPTHPHKGGVARHTTELARRLEAAGDDVVIESWAKQYPALLYPGQPHVTEPDTEPFGPTRSRLRWDRPVGWWRIGGELGRDRGLVVLALTTPVQAPALAAVAAAAHRGGARVVVVAHNVLPHERRPGDVSLVRSLLRRADGVLVHSDEQAGLAARLTTAAIAVAPLAPHLPESTAEPVAAADADRSEPLRSLLFFGLVRPYKGLDLLLEALARGPEDVTLTVAGEFWGGMDRTARRLHDLGLTGRVRVFPGYVPSRRVAELFADADALVLPYRHATASQNALLAFSLGLPVVATRVGGLAAAVTDGVDGLLCAPTVDDLARALHRLYEPGVLAQLRAGVRPPDADVAWAAYLDVLRRLAVGPAVEPRRLAPRLRSLATDHLPRPWRG